MDYFLIGTIVLYLVGGAVAGTLAGLLGIGGGLVVVPFLVLMLPHQGVPDNYVMHMAVGTTLMITMCTAVSSIRAHHRSGGILWDIAKTMFPALFLGAIIGANIADSVPSRALQILFGLFALFTAAKFFIHFKPKTIRPMPNNWILRGWSLLFSSFCSLLGLSGGVLVVPYLNRHNIKMENAVATSAVGTLPIAVGGGFSFLITGLNEVGLPHYSTGYIYWPAFFGIAITTIFFAPLGAKLAHRLPEKILKRVFAIFMIVVGIDMLFG